MKKITYLSKIVLSTGMLVFTMNSCKNEPKHADPIQTTEDVNETKFETKDLKDDSSFLADAAAINIFQIEVGQLAQEKALSASVKNYANNLVADYTKSLEELKTVANKKTITLPTEISEEDQTKYNELKEKSGAEFDKKFIEMMIDGHEKAVDKMTEIAQKVSDGDVKLWASRQTTIFISHSDEAKKLKE